MTAMPAKVILIVEDEKAIRDMIAFGLRRGGFEIREAQDCRAARTEIAGRRPDLLLVDWMLPDMTGLEFTRQLKRDPNLKELPVIMLTARAEEADKVAGLEGGADDYVTKPFSTRELMARIQAVLRRVDPAVGGEIVDIEGLRLDRIWGGNVYVEERTIDVHIRRLRKALEEFGYDRLVQTVRGAGYRFSGRGE
jgi:two-component system phosphate regulon response regulator PhoB